MKRAPIWAVSEIQYIRQNAQQQTAKDIAQALNRSESAVFQRAHRYNISLRKSYPRNSRYFEQIDSEEKAYILGFIYADGYVSKPIRYDRRIQIALHPKDIDILERIRKEIGYMGPLLKENNKIKLVISDKKIHYDLTDIGLFNNKSLTITYPKTLSPAWNRCFIRGFFDGDGCITKPSGNKHYIASICAGSKDMLASIQSVISREIGCRGSLRKDKRSSCFNLIYYTQEVPILLAWLYKNSKIHLNRKYQKYLDAMKIAQDRYDSIGRKIRHYDNFYNNQSHYEL